MLQAITCLFNPVGYKTKLHNFVRFGHKLCQQQKIPLLTVEWSHDEDYAIKSEQWWLHRIIHVTSPDVMWMKERLLNIALAHLDDSCTNVLWVDNDVLFQNERIAADINHALEQFDVIQPFERVVRLPQGVHQFIGGAPTHYSYGFKAARYGKELFGICQEEKVGTIGYAWAARRDFLDKIGGFYDAAILDGGDRLMASAFAGNPNRGFLQERLNCYQFEHFKQWGDKVPADTKVGYAPGVLLHLWHGDIRNRMYTQRHEVFSSFGFNPYRDIRLDEAGCWRWQTRKTEMIKMVRNYFTWRKEDG